MRMSCSMVNKAISPFSSASAPPVVVRFCPSETINTCMMITMPSMPTMTPIMISIRLNPRSDRRPWCLLKNILCPPTLAIDLRHGDVLVRGGFLRPLPADGYRYQIIRADNNLLQG